VDERQVTELEIALARALAGDPSIPGMGRLCQELLAARVGGEIMRPPEPMPERRKKGASNQPRTMPIDDPRRLPKSEETKAKIRATWARKRKAKQGITV
jgi:hypothetical protein